MTQLNVKQLALKMAKESGSVRSGDLVKATGKSRKAVHNNLVALCKEGLLAREGAGRSAHYVFVGNRERVRSTNSESSTKGSFGENSSMSPRFRT